MGSARALAGVLGLSLVICLPIAPAQDVTLAPLQWVEAMDAPETLPAVKGRLQVEFPAELRSTPDIGYVIFHAVISSKDRLVGFSPHASLEAYARAAIQPPQKWEFSAARRQGRAVNSAVTVALLFNPASAAEGLADATPRLLAASVAKLPQPKGLKVTEVIPDRVVQVDVNVDEHGAIVGMKNVPKADAGPIARAAKNWRFAPARKAGQPVAATVRVPFVLTTFGGHPAGKLTQVPQVTFQARPQYPMLMRQSGLRGEVVVDFVVDVEGRVRNPYVIRSINPAFDDPAIEAVRKWRFEPGRVGDLPVPTHMQVPILFVLDFTSGGGADGLSTYRKADQSKLPEEFRYDTPPRLTGMVRPVYPYAALREGREGYAIVNFIVDAKGRVVRTEILEASHPDFGQALRAAVEQFTYQPAIKGGRPGMALQGFKQEFRRDESYQIVSEADLAMMAREKKRPESILVPADLDSPLVPLSRRPPRYPLADGGLKGKAEAKVELIIDEEGRARLPRAVEASNEAFAQAAISGVSAWRFEPPTRGGRSVAVRVLIPIGFTAEPALATK